MNKVVDMVLMNYNDAVVIFLIDGNVHSCLTLADDSVIK